MLNLSRRKPYATIQKRVGETPLEALKRLRTLKNIPASTPLTYAGRLDPMAEGTLLILIGEECKKQEKYHHLDKAYRFRVLFGLSSDSGDVLGLLRECHAPEVSFADLRRISKKFVGEITLPYPHFSSKTVEGKPLHEWTLEGRLGEIEIPEKKSTIYSLTPVALESVPKEELYKEALAKIGAVTEVTDPRKSLGNDFRRADVKTSWLHLYKSSHHQTYQVAEFVCTVSSGTYIRSLTSALAKELNTCALSYSINRTAVGKYARIGSFGFWRKKY